MKRLIFIAVCLFLNIPCMAEVIVVDEDGPYDFNNIQAAIDYSSPGDEIIVLPGTYTGPGNRDIDFLGKAITVRSIVPTNPALVALTIIDCNSIAGEEYYSGFIFQSGEDANSVLAGFTITKGSPAIKCQDHSSPAIAHCVITGNSFSQHGAIDIHDSSPTITNCTISDNIGAGIYCDYNGGSIIKNCIITGNTGYGRAGSGGGITVLDGICLVYDSLITANNVNNNGGAVYCSANGIMEFTNSTIANNSAQTGGGIWCATDDIRIENCIIWGNSDGSGSGLTAQIYSNSGSPDVWFSCIQDGNSNDVNIPFGDEQFNIDDDPCFVDADSNDFHLQPGSPCVDTGDPNFISEPDETDMDSEQRVMGGRVDMGADELTAELIPIIGILDDDFVFYSPLGGDDPEPQILSIYNAGAGALNWQIIENCPWLTAEPNTGSSTGQINNVNLLVDISALDGGEYNCNLIISDSNASNNPQFVSVTLTVDEYAGPTIQAAINNANNGDTIIIADGIYKGPGNRDIDFLGKEITVKSANGPNSCIIDCNGLGNGFNIQSNSILDGFTITNGVEHLRRGGGIYCGGGSSPTISNCVITGNICSGILCESASPMVTDCIITGNEGSLGYGRGFGGGISVVNSLCVVYNSIIIGNNVNASGGGIYCADGGDVKLVDCIITGNSAGYGGGIYCEFESGLKVQNCTVTGNSAVLDGGGIWCEDNASEISSCILWANTDSSGTGQSAQIYGDQARVWFSCIQDDDPNDDQIPFGEENGNIDDDPCFVDADSNDFHLKANSPCVETGDPYFTNNTSDVDIDGQSRLMGQFVDMGADELELSVIVVTKPQAGDVWTAGSTHQIEWESYDISGNVDIYMQISPFHGHINVPDTGSHTWHIPPFAEDFNQCIVSILPNTPPANLIAIDSGLFTIHTDFNGPPVASKWKSLGGDYDRAGLSEHVGPETGCIKWQFSTDGPVTTGVAIGYNDNVHISCEDGKLYTLDSYGSLLWTFDANSPLLSSPSIGPDGSVFVGAQNGKLYAVDPNGNIRWTHTTDGIVSSSPAVSTAGDIYVGSQDGTLYALGPDGSELWTFQTAGLGVASGAIFASPAIGPDGTIYITGFYDPNLYALDPNTGSVKWNCTFSDPCDDPCNLRLAPFASPVIAPDGTIYQALTSNPRRSVDRGGYWYDSKLYAIDPNSGTVLWSTNMTETAKTYEEMVFPPPPPDPNCLFRQYYGNLADDDKRPFVYPYTASYKGSRSGVKRYFRVSNSSWSEPVLAPDGTIYTSFNDQYLRAVDPNGSIKLVVSLGWFGGFTMTVGSNGLIYTASDSDDLSVVDPNGKEIARFEGSGKLSFPVIAADNSIIVSDSDNTIWAISSDDCEALPAALHKPHDLNTDWSVDLIDFAAMAELWLECTDTSYDPITETAYCNDDENQIFLFGDINRDQYVNFDDLAEIANHWLNEE